MYKERDDYFIDAKISLILKKTHFIDKKNLIQKNTKRHISDKMMSIIRQKSAEFTMQVYYTIRLTNKTLQK